MAHSRVESLKLYISSLLNEKAALRSAHVVSMTAWQDLKLKLDAAHLALNQALKEKRSPKP